MLIADAKELESCRPQSNDERMAQWALKYFSAGHHRNPTEHNGENRGQKVSQEEV